MADDIRLLRQEADAHGGWVAWDREVVDFRRRAMDTLVRQRAESDDNVVVGEEGFLFSVLERSYLPMQAFVTRPAPNGREASPALRSVITLSRKLALRNIDLVFIPVPNRVEVYPDRVAQGAPADLVIIPGRKRFILELLLNGVETIDLLPAFLNLRDRTEEPIFHVNDTHWARRGIQAAAVVVSERLKRYAFVQDALGSGQQYGTREVTMDAPYALRPPQTAGRQTTESVRWKVDRVISPSSLIDSGSPILVVGDSFVFHMHGAGGGFSQHLAGHIGMPVSSLFRLASGPETPSMIARQSQETQAKRKVVVWVMSAAFLVSRYDSRWRNPELPTKGD